MKPLATAKRPVSLVQFCSLLIALLGMLLILGLNVHFTLAAVGVDRGYLTNSQELLYIRQQAEGGIEPFASRVNYFLTHISAPTAWAYGTVGGSYMDAGDCVSASGDPSGVFLSQRGGAQGVYEKMIAYYLTGNLDYAIVARQKILDLTRSYNFDGNDYSGGNRCILELGFAIPLWIQAADLLETTAIWTSADKYQFQTWLATHVYHKVAWASAVRRNNWGTAGSLAASMIADYLWDSALLLTEVNPIARSLSPAQAFLLHNSNQLQRMNTVWKGDSQCTIYGIRPYGGIPDELRRGTTGCTGQWLLTNDDSFMYQILEVEHLVFHAEYLSRRGNLSIYNNIAADGSGSLLKAITFVIANPLNLSKSYDWTTSKRGVLFVANTHYRNAAITAELTASTTVRRGSMVAFAELTHVLDIVLGTSISTIASPTATATTTPYSTATTVPTTMPTTAPTLIPTQVLTTPITGTSLSLNPIADAYVASNYANANYGTVNGLRVDSSPTTRSYMRFTVPAFTGTVVSARLRLFTKNSLRTGYSLHTTNGAWAENSINFGNAPSFSPVLALSLPSGSGRWVEVSLNGLITTAGDYNFVVVTSSTSSTAFNSRESSSNKPELVLVFDTTSAASAVVIVGTPENAAVGLEPSPSPMATLTMMPSSTPIEPTEMPTEMPTNTAMPTEMPTEMLTNTAIPTDVPTEMPTNTPIPTFVPTEIPTEMPLATQGS